MSKKVVILGAGVIGLATAYYCAARGFKVTVIDHREADAKGTSHGNAGMIVPSHFIPLAAPGMVSLGLKWMWNPASPFYIKPRLDADLLAWGYKFWRSANAGHVRQAGPLLRDLALASRLAFEELATASGDDFGLVKKGLLMLCQTQHGLDEEAKTAEQARALGIPAEVLDTRATSRLDPGATLQVAGSIYFPKDCHFTPADFMTSLRRRCEAAGVTLIWERKVVEFRREKQRIAGVQLINGCEISADELVICSGSWTPELVKTLGWSLPMQAGKGYSLTLPQPRQLPQLCTILTEARVAVTPMGGTLRVGGTMEISGLDESINPVRVRGIIESFCRYYPAFTPADFGGIQPWAGLRPCSPDGLPYVGRTRRFENLSLATGHAMMGMTLAPVTGQIMASLLAGEKPAYDLTLLSPDRHG